MKFTKNAKIFAAINSVTTLVFLTNLNHSVTSEQFDEIAPWAIVYGLIWAVSGAVLGITDKAHNYRGNIDLQYSLISSILALATLWLARIFLPAIMPVGYGYLVILSIAIIVASAIQFYFANKDTKGIGKQEAHK